MGSGTRAHAERAVPLGQALARLGVHLLTGGGGGVMAAVSAAFAAVPERRGLVIGVLPGREVEGSVRAPEGYPNEAVELAIRTHLPWSGTRGTDPLSRNHVNVLSSDAIVALPGGAGTASEVRLALRYGRPVLAFVGARGEIPDLPAEVEVVGATEALLARLGALLPGE